MNLPNGITVARILLVPLFVILGYGTTASRAIAALVVFAAASVSDFADGYVARRRGTVSRTGKFLDPLADKLLVGAALVVLVDTGPFPLWAALVIAVREAAVQLLRIRIVKRGLDLPASQAAKMKTVSQLVMVCWWLWPWASVNYVHWTLVACALATTLWSGAEYLVGSRPAPSDAGAHSV